MTDIPDYNDMDPVMLPITDTLDLHHFNPAEVKSLIHEYIRECKKKGLFTVKIIHGKGKGILKQRVRDILTSHTDVHSFADGGMGNWGTTRIELKR